ncbi:GTP cyclohydrolase I [Streptomyces mobaraensis]|uniref:GTP cyclohydrolase I n=1 Tax=Streptomyces mobaraensis TaxID=35621 RepID=UPI001F04E1A9|nr:GTP cyclohydrolase I [Streptomyces mobaraensis]
MAHTSGSKRGAAPAPLSESERLRFAGALRHNKTCIHEDPLLPMRPELAIGHRPYGSVLGLSKFARIVAAHAHRLRLQERIVDDAATDGAKTTGSADVGVAADATHRCMSMRSVRQDQARTLSHSLSSALGSRLLAAAGTGPR